MITYYKKRKKEVFLRKTLRFVLWLTLSLNWYVILNVVVVAALA